MSCASQPRRTAAADSVFLPLRPMLPIGTRLGTGLYLPRRQVIRDSVTWEATWRDIKRGSIPPRPAPVVDFARDMVVLVAMGNRPTYGYLISITGVFVRRDTLRIQVWQQCPSDDPNHGVAPAMTAPIDLAQLPKREEPAVFVEREAAVCARRRAR